jgi:DNA end-binding protein Ku
MPRAIWKGSISFGLVQIPVGLYTAEEPDEIHFSMLDRRNMSPIRFERINKETGKPVPYEEIVKGFETEDGEYVIVTPEELKAANVEATQTVDIVAFVEASEIEPYYFERPYYLAPTKPGTKAYALLRETLRRSGRVGVAKVVIRTRQHIAALWVHEDVMVLNLLRYAHELRDAKDLDVPSSNLRQVGVTPKEIEMAERLVEGMIDSWAPEQFRDEYRDDVLAMIEQKRETGTVEIPAAPKRKKAEVVDIMTLLKQSLEQGKEVRGAKEIRRAPKAAKVARKKSAPKKATKRAAKKTKKKG